MPPASCLRYDLPGAACLVSSVDRCSVSSVWACVVPCMVCPGTCPVLVLARPALLPVTCNPSGCAGAWISTSGVYGASRGWGWSVARIPKPIKRRFSCLPTPSFLHKSPYPLLPISKIPRKNKKTPTKCLCSVLYLPYKP